MIKRSPIFVYHPLPGLPVAFRLRPEDWDSFADYIGRCVGLASRDMLVFAALTTVIG